MSLAGTILSSLIYIYLLIVLMRVILDWIPPLDSGFLRRITLYAHILTEPPLALLRRLVPMIPMGEGMALDMSPFILTVLLIVLQRVVSSIF